MTEYIKYKKKEYPISVSYYCIKKTRREMGIAEKDFNAIVTKEDGKDSQFNIEMYESMLYHALVAGAEEEDVEMDIPKEKMEFVLDGCFQQFLELVKKFYPDDETIEEGKKQAPVGNRQQRRTGKTITKKKSPIPGT